MPPDDLQIEAAASWLARARSNLLLARQAPLPEVFLEDLAFQAQQAGEKAIKAVYLRLGLAFRYTHNLEELLAGLESTGCTIPATVRESVTLTRFAVEARYPSPTEPLTQDELLEAIHLAEVVSIGRPKLSRIIDTSNAPLTRAATVFLIQSDIV